MMPTPTPGQSGTAEVFDSLYALSIDSDAGQFNRRNGVFYPSGFALLALPDQKSLGHAVRILLDGGIPRNEITLLRPEQMRQLAERSKSEAGMLAQVVGAELKQLDVLEQLAGIGNNFLLVANTKESRPLLETIGAKSGVSKGLLYHTLAVEELPVDKETIPGTSPFGVNEVIRSQESDADMDNKHQP